VGGPPAPHPTAPKPVGGGGKEGKQHTHMKSKESGQRTPNDNDSTTKVNAAETVALPTVPSRGAYFG
jgi:hypothetical protein